MKTLNELHKEFAKHRGHWDFGLLVNITKAKNLWLNRQRKKRENYKYVYECG